jgi:YVTN family beta-propeller protein
VWVTNFFSSTVTKLRASDGAVLGTFALGSEPAGIAYDGSTLWIANSGSNTVVRVRPADGGVIATYAVGKGPLGVAFDGASMWSANFGSDSVSTTAVVSSSGTAVMD